MGYRNKTYVVFDGKNDIGYYRLMTAWKNNKHIDFDFYDAHDLNTITNRASETTTKQKLRVRMANAKQVVVLVGEHTKNKHRFVRWEQELAMEKGLPIIAVNLNRKRAYDPNLCPPILRGAFVVHVSFNAAIIRYALDHFPIQYAKEGQSHAGDLFYGADVYSNLGL